MTGQLSGKLTLVTGGASGIGRGICRLFAEEGASVVAVDINEQGLQETIASLKGDSHSSIVTDVSSSTQVANLIPKVKSTCDGRVPNVVVNCAGITITAPTVDFKEEDYDTMANINMKGTFLVMQATAQAMLEQGIKDGSIINISSQNGQSGYANFAAYSATKAGQVAMTRSCAKEWGRIPIRVNAVLPGPIATGQAVGVDNPGRRKWELDSTPMKRNGTTHEVATACVFLASDQRRFVTGASLPVTGGFLL